MLHEVAHGVWMLAAGNLRVPIARHVLRAYGRDVQPRARAKVSNEAVHRMRVFRVRAFRLGNLFPAQPIAQPTFRREESDRLAARAFQDFPDKLPRPRFRERPARGHALRALQGKTEFQRLRAVCLTRRFL